MYKPLNLSTMNLKELDELLNSLKNDPKNQDLLEFYTKKRKELVQRINVIVNAELKKQHLFN